MVGFERLLSATGVFLDILIRWLLSEKSAGLMTLVTGYIAYRLYKAQLKENKRAAANILLSEIRTAERNIENVRSILEEKESQLATIPILRLLVSNNWNKFSHLFVKDFDQDEIGLINQFYAKCELADRELQFIQDELRIAMEQKMRSLQDALIALIKEKGKEYDKSWQEISKLIQENSYFYIPYNPRIKLLIYLKQIANIATSSVGTKLKSISSF